MILNICDNPSVLEVIRIINMVILIVKIAVPILLILTGMITLMKTIKVADDVLLAKAKKQLISNAVAAIVIFLIPTLVNVLVKVSDTNNQYKDCLYSANFDGINQKYYENAETAVSKAESTKTYNDYYEALSKVNEVKDAEQRKSFMNRLDTVKSSIDNKIKEDNKKEDTKSESNSTNSGNSNNTNVPSDTDASNGDYHVNSINRIKYNLYNQGDSRWGSVKYDSNDDIASNGCMITSIAVLSSAYDSSITPLTVFNSNYRHRSAYKGVNALSNNTFSCYQNNSMSNSDIVSNLKSGNVVIIMVKAKSNFTNSQHYMALIDIKQDGSQIFVGNSYGKGTGTYSRNGWFNTDTVLYDKREVNVCTPTSTLLNKYN